MSLPDIEALVPHRGPALWLDRVLTHARDTTRCAVRIVPSHPLADDEGRMPGVSAMEMMAQATAAHSALCGRAGGVAEIGVVAGVSDLVLDVVDFGPGDTIEVEVVQASGGDGTIATFAGSVEIEGRRVASGRVTVVRGENARGGAA